MHSNFFVRKTKKNMILFRYSGNYAYFCRINQYRTINKQNKNKKIKTIKQWLKL